jgi:leader peptidase (prepilin peptidase)/N-methyltransferase
MMEIIDFFNANLNTFLLLVAAFSLLIGSFLNVVIYRLPHIIQDAWSQECREYLGLKKTTEDTLKLNLHIPFSHCTQCKETLKPWHNIPILSFLILGGKCAYCRTKISPRYPLVELLCCAASVYVAWRFGVSWQTAAGLIFTWIMIPLVFIDLDHHLLPDHLTLLLVWIGLFISIFSVFSNSTDAIIGAITGYLIFAIVQWSFKLITGKIGMGQGDYKFLAGLGAFLGWQQLPIIVLFASLSGLIFGLTHMALKHQFKSTPMPFGPHLAIAGWVSMMWGNTILGIYAHHFMMTLP